jgi:hypothetical protein
VSWPYSPNECPRCRSFHRFSPPALDDAGYEVVGFCANARIATDLFVLRLRDPAALDSCPCFSPRQGEAEPTRAPRAP